MSTDEVRDAATGGSPADRLSVAAGAVALVLAVWASLWIAQSRNSATGETRPPDVTLPGDLDGFRPDLFYLPDDSLLGFVAIPEGPFIMGSDPGVDRLAFDLEWWGEGRVQGTVELPRFHMARFETTVAQYGAFVREANHPLPNPGSLAAPADHPVTSVAWTDAVAYARWLDGALRENPATPPALRLLLDEGWRVALPSEAEWEKAARGDDARIYPWGDQPPGNRANYRASSTSRVGSFSCPDCAHGLSDMAGNVWEWTRSPYQPYPFDESDDLETAGTDALWVMRGGSFADNEQFVRAANRGGADPGARRAFIGFRVALVR
ncbi:MAG: formylglycine-generating enzyme family protein [Gemmatimonadetes bacterium]|nr:formylglycine-generating enzyme family protein [Gemmatimonadota bacterium]